MITQMVKVSGVIKNDQKKQNKKKGNKKLTKIYKEKITKDKVVSRQSLGGIPSPSLPLILMCWFTSLFYMSNKSGNIISTGVCMTVLVKECMYPNMYLSISTWLIIFL